VIGRGSVRCYRIFSLDFLDLWFVSSLLSGLCGFLASVHVIAFCCLWGLKCNPPGGRFTVLVILAGLIGFESLGPSGLNARSSGLGMGNSGSELSFTFRYHPLTFSNCLHLLFIATLL